MPRRTPPKTKQVNRPIPAQKIQTASSNNFPSFKKIAVTFVVLAIILLAFIIYFSFAKATITLNLTDEPKKINFEMTVSATSSDTDLLGTLINKQIKVGQEFTVENFSQEDGVATGNIKIINKHTKSQALVKTTRFLTPDGLLFRLSKTVSVPAGSEIVAKIYSDQTGAKYDIEATHFTIPGLSESLQKVIYGMTDEPTTGGIKKVGVLTQTDVDMSLKKFEDNLVDLVKASFDADEDYKDSIILENLILANVTESEVNEKVGDEVDKFTITADVDVKAVVIDYEEMLELAKDKYRQKNILGQTIVSWDMENFDYSLKDFNTDNRIATISGDLSAQVSNSFNLEKFDKSEIAGFDKKGIEYYFSQYPGIQEIEIKFSPFWVKSAPVLSDRIEVKIK